MQLTDTRPTYCRTVMVYADKRDAFSEDDNTFLFGVDWEKGFAVPQTDGPLAEESAYVLQSPRGTQASLYVLKEDSQQ